MEIDPLDEIEADVAHCEQMEKERGKYPPLTTASLISYSHLGPFSEVVPAEKMAELEGRVLLATKRIAELDGNHFTNSDEQKIVDLFKKILCS